MSRRRVDQVSDEQECAHANESCQADGEQKPDEFDLLGLRWRLRIVHLPELRFTADNTARHCDGEKAVRSLASVPLLDLSVARGFGPRGSIGAWGDP